MAVFRRGQHWWIDFYIDRKRRREKIGPSKKLAETVLKKRLVEIAEGKFLDVKRKPEIGFDEAVEKYMEWAISNKSSWDRDKVSLSHWLKEFSGRKLSDISKLDVERYKMRRKDEVAPRTANEELACLRRLFYRMMDWGFAEGNPVKGIKFLRQPPGRIKFLSEEEKDRLLDACNSYLKPVVMTALFAGLRRGEILSLKWEDIDFRRNVIIVRNSKNGERREVAISERLREVLAALPRNDERVFSCRNGSSYKSIRTAFTTAVRKAGFVDLRFHDLRHVFATTLKNRGADLDDIKEFLGHKSLDMVMRYAHITSERKQETIKLLDGHCLDTGGEETVLSAIDKR
jgi:integrase